MADPLDPKNDDYNFLREKKQPEEQQPKQRQQQQQQQHHHHQSWQEKSKDDDYMMHHDISQNNNNNNNVTNPKIVAAKKIPSTNWLIVLTDTDHEFFHNVKSLQSQWVMPDELGEIVGDLIAQALAQPSESEEEEQHFIEEQNNEIAPDTLPEAVPEAVPEVEPEISLEEGKLKFRQLLDETKTIDPFSTWESAGSQLCKDPRFDLIPTSEARKLFDVYCSELVAKKKAEKKATPVEKFQALLDRTTTHRTSLDEFTRKNRRDVVFTAIKTKERERMFRAHIIKLKDAESERRKRANMSKQDLFIQLLKETNLSAASRWSDFKATLEKDPRCEVPDPQSLFNEYILDTFSTKTALEMRQEQVRKEREEMDSKLSSHKSTVQSRESRKLMAIILSDIVKDGKSSFKAYLPYLEKHPRWSEVSQVMTYKEQRYAFSKYVGTLQDRIGAKFIQELEKKYTKQQIFSLTYTNNEIIQQLPESNEQVYNNYKDQLVEKSFLELKQGIEENSYILYHVKSYVQDVLLDTSSVEWTRDMIWKEFEETGEVDTISSQLETQDNSWQILSIFKSERKEMLDECLKSMIEKNLNEKGGTVDQTLVFGGSSSSNTKKRGFFGGEGGGGIQIRNDDPTRTGSNNTAVSNKRIRKE